MLAIDFFFTTALSLQLLTAIDKHRFLVDHELYPSGYSWSWKVAFATFTYA